MQGADLIRISVSLVLIVGLILLSAWLAKRSGLLRPKGPQRINILSSQSLGPRTNVVLVEVGKQQLLLGVTPQQITTLHRFENGPDTVETRTSTTANEQAQASTAATPSNSASATDFKSLLRRRQQQHQDPNT